MTLFRKRNIVVGVVALALGVSTVFGIGKAFGAFGKSSENIIGKRFQGYSVTPALIFIDGPSGPTSQRLKKIPEPPNFPMNSREFFILSAPPKWSGIFITSRLQPKGLMPLLICVHEAALSNR